MSDAQVVVVADDQMSATIGNITVVAVPTGKPNSCVGCGHYSTSLTVKTVPPVCIALPCCDDERYDRQDVIWRRQP